MRWPILMLLGMLILLQYQLWLGEHSVPGLWTLEDDINAQQQRNDDQNAINRALRDEVHALKNDPEMIEEYAREELGMIKEGERFIMFSDDSVTPSPVQSPAPSPANNTAQ